MQVAKYILTTSVETKRRKVKTVREDSIILNANEPIHALLNFSKLKTRLTVDLNGFCFFFLKNN